jgi:hypothetical protein
MELETEENTLFAFVPTSRMVPTTITRITASITAYSAMSCPASSDHKNPKSNILTLLFVEVIICLITIVPGQILGHRREGEGLWPFVCELPYQPASHVLVLRASSGYMKSALLALSTSLYRNGLLLARWCHLPTQSGHSHCGELSLGCAQCSILTCFSIDSPPSKSQIRLNPGVVTVRG